MQPSLFDSPADSWHSVITPQEDGDVRLYPALIDAHDTPAVFDVLRSEIAWEQREIQVYGKALFTTAITGMVWRRGHPLSLFR